MITQKCLQREIRRLLRLPFAPADEAGLKATTEEFERVLRKYCDSDEHCALVVTAVVDSSARCPAPSEIVAQAKEINPPDTTKAPLGCEECNGIGFVIVERGDTSAADFCRCGLGEFKRAGAARHQAERAQKAAR